MKQHQLFYIIATLLLYSCTQPNQTLSLNETNWEFAQLGTHSFKPATVPGTIQTNLLAQGDIPDPFLLSNEDSIQWVSATDWEVRTKFSLSKKQHRKKNHILRFEGLDTYADIFLNDSLIATANNAFRTWEIDVSAILKVENKLRVVFRSTDTIETQKAAELAYTLPEAPRVFTRKPQFQYGWDWGPTIKTMGIWRNVSLLSYNEIRLKDAFLQTERITDTLATLTGIFDVQTPEYANCTFEITNKTTRESFRFPAEIYGPESTYFFEIPVKNPKLWWTHNLGAPFLYDFTIRLKHNNVVVDSVSKKVGIRTIQLVTEKDSIGEGFYFKLNGKKVYMKGANYIPQHILLPEVSHNDREKLLNDVVAANMNMLRIWGGGVYEDDAFYNICDAKGILLWQDFMFACAMYPGDAAFLANIKAEAIDNVKRLRQHPSIALWCGNNENSEGWHRWGWQDDKTEAQKEEIWKNYQNVFNKILPHVVDSLHPTISYWESSPKYGRGDKRYQFEGDAHDWWVWHDGVPFEHFEESVPRFMSEFGFQAFPSYETILQFTQSDSIDISHPSFETHQKHSRGFQLIQEYMQRDYRVPTNTKDYVYVSQLLQAYGISKGILAHRRAKPYNMGTLYWQLNDCWPAVSWSSIDGLGNWKALHYKARRAFEDRLLIAWEEDEKLKITIVDDTFESLQDTLKLAIKDFKGITIKEHTVYNVKTNIRENEVFMELSLTDFEFDPTRSFAEITFGKVKTMYYFEKPKNLRLTNAPIVMTQEKNNVGVAITLSANTLQKDVFLTAGAPGHFSDNFFDLLPGATKTVQFIPKKELPVEIFINSLNRINNNDKKEIPGYPVN